MSRCFPFPPPGYERKAIPDDVNLLIKEKHKQKKHKEKKDKDKKERSERKEKERREGKHKKDKDRKEKKHKDKKDKREDKERPSEEKKVVGPSENRNGESFSPISKPQDQIQDHKILVELGKRLRDDTGATDSQMVHKNTFTEQKNGFVGNFSGENKAKGESRQVDAVEKGKEGKKEKKKHKNSDGKGDGHKNRDRDKNIKKEEKKRKEEKENEKKAEEVKPRENGGIFPPFHNNKPANPLKESRDSQGNQPKLKAPPLNGFLHDNGIRHNIMSRPTSSSQVGQIGSGSDPSQNITNLGMEKGGVITNHKVNCKVSSSLSVSKHENGTEQGRTANYFTADHRRPVINNHAVSNGFISPHIVGTERKIEPHKTTSNVAKVDQHVVNGLRVDNKVPSSNPFVENGRNMIGPDVVKASERRGPDNAKVDNKEAVMNGLSRASSASVKAKEKVDTHKRPPHPDTNYLSQIYDVPPKLEWPVFDDQDWLFNCEGSRAKRPKLASSDIEPAKHVWAAAIQMESADVTALPYVIPY